MLFIPILILAIVLYLTGKRVGAIVLFFFFLQDGFQLVPEAFFDAKPKDFALVFVVVLFVWGCIRYEDFIPRNKLTLFIGIYLLFILCAIWVSKSHYHISWGEIIRTSRHYFLVLAYFVLRRLTKTEVVHILRILLVILLVQCCLFAIQVFTGLDLLTGGKANFYLGWIYRCYNVPNLIYFLMFYALFRNPFRGRLKYISMVIPAITIFLPMHRSWSLSFVFVAAIGVLIAFDVLRSKKRILIASIIAIPLVLAMGSYVTSRTIEDIKSVTKGDFLEVDAVKLDVESTLLFRAAHFYERFLFVTETTKGSLFGVGFMTEDSKYTFNNFDFITGLQAEDSHDIVQLDTSDTAWSNFIIRYGVLGTIIYLLLYGYLFIFYYGKRKDSFVGLPMMLYLLFIVCISFTDDGFYYVNMLMLPFLTYDISRNEKADDSDITLQVR